MAIIILFVMASLLIGAVVFGVLRNDKKSKPTHEEATADKPRKGN